jgi:cytochrome c biogenesis protein CcmG/thiol:disulfide interchange protein DsbE
MRSMTLRRLGLALACGALLAAACGSNAPSTPARLPTEPTALPEFTLADYRHALGELRGTPVVVNFWASWCGPCREEAPLLAAANETYGDRVRFIGVDILDERGSARDFMREYGWTYPSVFDPSGAIRDGLGLLGQPVTLFYDASGELVDTWTGPLTWEALRSRLETILVRRAAPSHP